MSKKYLETVFFEILFSYVNLNVVLSPCKFVNIHLADWTWETWFLRLVLLLSCWETQGSHFATLCLSFHISKQWIIKVTLFHIKQDHLNAWADICIIICWIRKRQEWSCGHFTLFIGSLHFLTPGISMLFNLRLFSHVLITWEPQHQTLKDKYSNRATWCGGRRKGHIFSWNTKEL